LDVENLQHIWRLTDNHRHAPGGCLDLRDVAGRGGSSGACEWTEGACPRANARDGPVVPPWLFLPNSLSGVTLGCAGLLDAPLQRRMEHRIALPRANYVTIEVSPPW
jgi:hypothetical protein